MKLSRRAKHDSTELASLLTVKSLSVVKPAYMRHSSGVTAHCTARHVRTVRDY
jgi:hypothetical protein